MPAEAAVALGIRGLKACIIAVGATALANAGAGGAGTLDEPRLEAYFTSRSAVPGRTATLFVRGPSATKAEVQVFYVGPNARHADRSNSITGVPVNSVRTVDVGSNWRRVSLPVWHWPSGLYFARVRTGKHGSAVAPLVVRATSFSRPRVAVVIPTNTWQAYNRRDDDGDGDADSWYFNDSVSTVGLDRPYHDRGVPPFYRAYDQPLVAWLARSGKRADFLSDDDLDRFSSELLIKLYDLIVFAGHEEYVTTHEYDVIEQFRDAGGNLLFCSANNFFYRVIRDGETLTRDGRWRDLGRPEAALVGVQYVGWYENSYPNAPYVVTGSADAPWLFRGTRLVDGSQFGTFGIEIDARTPSSPPQTRVLAVAKNIFGPGMNAEMTYYTTTAGAKVFAAGALNFGGSAWSSTVALMLENLWATLSRP
jgi:hypothetical protein